MLKKASLFLFLFLIFASKGKAQYIKWQEDKSVNFLRLHLVTHEIDRYNPSTGWAKLDTIKSIGVDFKDILPKTLSKYYYKTDHFEEIIEGIYSAENDISETYKLTKRITKIRIDNK
jgi:hypothetical protein